MKQQTEFKMSSIDPNNGELEISIKGSTELPFWNHDLKFQAALALLETIDRKDFFENNEGKLFLEYMNELKGLLDALED